jgi:hypothetical protein
MNPQQRSLLAMALAIREELGRRQKPKSVASLPPIGRLRNIARLSRRIRRADERGWHRAAARLAEQQTRQAASLRPQVNAWLGEIESRPTSFIPKRLPNSKELFRDLVALEAEFGEVTCDWDHTELFVTTDDIRLEGIDLGRFDIRLNWAAVGESTTPYRIVARDPNPAGSNNDVTHPHVRDEALCPGNGRSAIALALADWRLFDFFVIVNQILLTYSAGNAHVELEDWGGTPCHDCDSSVDSEDRYHCQGCDCTLCGDCGTSCASCDGTFCSTCVATCEHCSEYHCSRCLSECLQCKAAVCSDCREHETLCKKCHEREQAAADEEESVERPPPQRDERARAAV